MNALQNVLDLQKEMLILFWAGAICKIVLIFLTIPICLITTRYQRSAMKLFVEQKTMVTKDARPKRILEEHARDGINKHHNHIIRS